MSVPPPYPRIPYLVPADDRTVDDVLVGTSRDRWFTEPVVVEEKLDGANVMLWQHDGRIEVASRGGPGSMDRAGQLGRLRAWAAVRAEHLTPVLAHGRAIYGEWLWLAHAVRYRALPDLLVVLDLWSAHSRFADVDGRNAVAGAAGLMTPPELFRGVLGNPARLTALLGRARWSTEPAEGLVLRSWAGARAKVVRPSFRQRSDNDWAGEREFNTLAETEARVR